MIAVLYKIFAMAARLMIYHTTLSAKYDDITPLKLQNFHENFCYLQNSPRSVRMDFQHKSLRFVPL
jgi:hypothetical protein